MHDSESEASDLNKECLTWSDFWVMDFGQQDFMKIYNICIFATEASLSFIEIPPPTRVVVVGSRIFPDRS